MVPMRIECDNYDITLNGGGDSLHMLTVSVARSNEGKVEEIVFVGRGKTGHGIDLMFADLGIKLSKILQHRDPSVGGDDD